MIIEEGSFYCRLAAKLGLESVAGELLSDIQVQLGAPDPVQPGAPDPVQLGAPDPVELAVQLLGAPDPAQLACTPPCSRPLQGLSSPCPETVLEETSDSHPLAQNIAAQDATLALVQQPGVPLLCTPVDRLPLGSDPPPLLQNSAAQDAAKWSTAASASSSVLVGPVNILLRVPRRRVSTKQTPKSSFLREVILSGFLDQSCQFAAVIAHKHVAHLCPAMIAKIRYGFMIERQVGTD